METVLKARIFIILLMFMGTAAFSQGNSFDELESQVVEKVNLRLWEDVLLLASDLVIADPSRGDGYLYIAIAFYHLEDEANMNKYLKKAERKADDALQQKIEAFKLEKTAVTNASSFEQDAKVFEKANNGILACEAWTNAWLEDKSRIDFALNAVGHHLDAKEYAKALEILNDPQVVVDPNAQLLIQKIYSTPTMVAKEGYEDAMSNGSEAYKAGNYEQALQQFNQALYHRNNDTEASNMRDACEEEISWQKAKQSDYIEDLEKYADKYPYGKYISTAKSNNKSSYISIAHTYASQGDESGMIDMHNRFLNRFSGDNDIMEIKKMLLDHYFAKAEANFKAKNFSAAKSYYQQYLAVNSNGDRASTCSYMIKRCDRQLNQRSSGMLLYTYDSQSPIGIQFGRLNKRGVGGYLNLKINKEIFTGFDVLYDIDDSGSHDHPGEVVLTGEIRYANACASAGLTFQLVYPLFGYIGAGAGYYPVYEEGDTYFSSGAYWETKWLRNTDQTQLLFYPEAGVKLKIANAIILKYGVMYQGEAIHQFGFGFAM